MRFPFRALRPQPTRRHHAVKNRKAQLHLEPLEERALLDAVRWINPQGGDWAIPANWSTGQLPGPADTAIIDLPGITVTHAGGTDTVADLVASNGTFVLGGGTLAVSRTVQGSSTVSIQGGHLVQATVEAGTTVTGTYLGGTLDEVTFAAGATLDVGTPFPSAQLNILNGLTMNGTTFLGSSAGASQGELHLQGTQAILGTGRFTIRQSGGLIDQAQTGGTLTIGPDLAVLIQGHLNVRSEGTLVNEATMIAPQAQTLTLDGGTVINRGPITVSGGTLMLTPGTWTNEATVQVTGGVLEVNGQNWVNRGTLTVTNSTVNLYGSFTPASVGDFRRTGGIVYVHGTLDARTQPLVLNAQTGTWLIDSGATLRGTVTVTEGAQVYASNSVWDGVTVNGDLELGYNGVGFSARNGLTINGTLYVGDPQNRYFGYILFQGVQTLSVSRGVIFSQDRANVLQVNGFLTIAAGTMIHGANGMIRGFSSQDALVNYGTIMPDVAQGTLAIQVSTFINAGSWGAANGGGLTVTGTWQTYNALQFSGGGFLALDGTWSYSFPLTVTSGTVYLYGNWRMNGSPLTVQNATVYVGNSSSTWLLGNLTMTNATVYLGGNFSRSSFGGLTRSGGTVNIVGNLDNTNNTLILDAASGSWNLAGGGRIRGGTVQTSGGAQLVGTGGTMDGITLNGDLDITSSNARAYVANGLVLNGTITLGTPAYSGGSLLFSGSQSLTTASGGTVLFTDNLNNGFGSDQFSGNVTLTIGAGVTLRGASGGINVGDGSLINRGTIQADLPGGQLTVYGATWTNAGTLSAVNGGQLHLNGHWTSPGNLIENDGTLQLDGNFTSDNLTHLSRNGGTIALLGRLDNRGFTFALNAATGPLVLSGGTILGGTVTESDGVEIFVSQQANNTLDGVIFDGDLHLTNFVALAIRDGLTLNGTFYLGDEAGAFGSQLTFLFAQTLSTDTSAAIVLGGSAANVVTITVNTGTVVTVGPHVLIHGHNGRIDAGTDGFVNQGTIAADVVNGLLSLGGTGWSNAGTIRAAAGGTFTTTGLPSNFHNGTLTGGVWQAVKGGTLRLNGAAIHANAATIHLAGADARFIRDSAGTGALADLAVNSPGARLELNAGFSLAVGTLTNAGTLVLGPGSTLTVAGDFTQTSRGTIKVRLGDHPDTGQFGQLLVTGTAVLDGSLRVTLTAGFVPDVGDAFRVLAWGERFGDFTSIDVPDLGLDRHLEAQVDDSGLSLLTVANLSASDESPLAYALTLTWADQRSNALLTL